MADEEIEKLVGSDLVLLLLWAPTKVASLRNRINGITRLEKLLFLASKQTSIQEQIDEPLNFVAYNFGPFSKDIYEAADILVQAGLIDDIRSSGGPGTDSLEEADTTPEVTDYSERCLSLTDDGKAVAEWLAEQHPEETSELSKIKDNFGDMSLRQLIRYVYGLFPDFAKNSLIADQFV